MFNIRVVTVSEDFIKGYLLDVYLNESLFVEVDIRGLKLSNLTSKYVLVDDLLKPTKIKALKPVILKARARVNNRYTFINKFSGGDDFYIDVVSNKRMYMNSVYLMFIYKEEGQNFYLESYVKVLEKIEVFADRLKYVDRDLGYSYFMDTDEKVYKLESNRFLIKDRYLAYGFQTTDAFRIVHNIDIITADVVIKHIYSGQDDYMVFAKAEFLSYPNNKRIPTSNLYIKGLFQKCFIDDEFTIKGYWEQNKKGYIFKVIESKRNFGRNIKVLKNFLLMSLKGNRIGEKTIDLIVDKFGLDSLSVIKNDADKLLEIKGVSEKMKDTIVEVIGGSSYLEKVMSFFIKNNLPLKYMDELYKEYGSSTIEKLRHNPYIILELTNVPFLLADKMAQNEGIKYNDPKRIEAAIYYFLMYDEKSNGNIFTYKDFLLDNLNNFVLSSGCYEESFTDLEIITSLEQLINIKKVVQEKLIEDYNTECLYLSYNNFLENNIVKKLKEVKSGLTYNLWNKEMIEEKINEFESETSFRLAEKQRLAISMALSNKISILTGGPGTGKTQTVNSIINVLKRLNKDATIGLTAPTGKASNRLSEITNIVAYTIHRKLKYRPFAGDIELEEITCDLLVVDEASMIDANLFYKLLSNVSEETNILFVGDHNQIPSVGAGLILKDLIDSKEIEVTILDEIFRQSDESSIVTISHDLISGKTTDNGLDIKGKEDFVFIEENNENLIKDKILRIIKEELKTRSINDIQVLTPLNIGELGTNILNYAVQGEVQDDNSLELRINPTTRFKINDKVMQTKNNYKLNVFNGTVGYVTSINKGQENVLTVAYDDEDIDYKMGDVSELMLAYAMTIHKSQGSEFPVVIIPVVNSHLFMNNRNLLYTAITRAKEKVYLIGSENVLNQVIEKKDCIKRNSQIKSKLQGKDIELPF